MTDLKSLLTARDAISNDDIVMVSFGIAENSRLLQFDPASISVGIRNEHARMAHLNELKNKVICAAADMVDVAERTRKTYTLTNGASGVSVNVNYGGVQEALAALRAEVGL